MSSKYINIPFSPKRFPFFYGWVILAVSTLILIMSIPGQVVCMAVFTDYFINAFKLSRTQISTTHMTGAIVSAIMLPFAGRFIDRFGLRISSVISSLGLAISLLTVILCQHILKRYQANPVFLSVFLSFICFLAIRFFGQGYMMMVSQVAIGKWFNHRRGLAVGILSVFATLTFNFAPSALDSLITSSLGWNGTFFVMAVIIGVGMVALGWIFFRDTPEQLGMVMDGTSDPVWLKKMTTRIPETKKEFTSSEAIKTIAFWALTLALASHSLIVSSFIFHATSIASFSDISRNQILMIFWPIAFWGILSTIIFSIASDRIKLKWLIIMMMAGLAIGTIGVLNIKLPFCKALVGIGYGISSGLFAPLITVALPRFFGRKHLGNINGSSLFVIIFAGSIGPVIFSKIQTMTGDYHNAFLICLFMPIAIMIAGFYAENPQEKL